MTSARIVVPVIGAGIPTTYESVPLEYMPRNAWLSPDGTLYSVPETGHAEYAFAVLHDPKYGDGIESRGWYHLSTGRSLYVTNIYGCHITDSQLSTLWDIYMTRPDYLVTWQHQAVAQLRRLLDITVSEA